MRTLSPPNYRYENSIRYWTTGSTWTCFTESYVIPPFPRANVFVLLSHRMLYADKKWVNGRNITNSRGKWWPAFTMLTTKTIEPIRVYSCRFIQSRDEKLKRKINIERIKKVRACLFWRRWDIWWTAFSFSCRQSKFFFFFFSNSSIVVAGWLWHETKVAPTSAGSGPKK